MPDIRPVIPPDISKYERNEFVQEKHLGNGTFGFVVLMNHKRLGRVAVKFFSTSSSNHFANRECQDREMNIMIYHNRHDNIVRFLSFVSDGDNIVGYSMEYMEGGNLHDVIHSDIAYITSDIVNWARQPIQALDWLHSKLIIHRDIKPGNLMFSEGLKKLKVCDFGTARPETNENKTLGVGSLMYTAPEILGDDELGPYNSKCDVYSMGIVIFEMCTRKKPFEIRNYRSLWMHIASGKRPLIDLVKDDKMRTLIYDCTDQDSNKRPSMEDLNLQLMSVDDSSVVVAAKEPINASPIKKENAAPEFSAETIQCFDLADMNFIRHIDTGGQGEVNTYSVPCYGTVAVKTLTAHKMSKYQRREMEVMRKFSFHPNLVQLYALVKSEDIHIGYAMEYMSGGALSAVIYSNAEYNENHYLSWATQACRAIAYLHQNCVLHRDIKPPSMLLDADGIRLKVGDFGLSRHAATQMTARAGTAYYTAPELFVFSKDGHSFYDDRCDVYSMAISLWEMVRRCSPYGFKNPAALQKAVMEGTRPSLEPGKHNIPTDVLEIITSHWVNVKARPPMHNMLMELEKACDERKVIIGKR